MAPKKIKVVDVLRDVVNDIEDIEDIVDIPIQTELKAIEEEPIDVQPVEEPIVEEPKVSNIKTVELVECPDCKKKLTMKSLKYSHAKNCIAKRPLKVEEIQDEETPEETPEEETQEEEEEEEEEEKKIEPIVAPPGLKRTVSVKPQPVKKTITKERGGNTPSGGDKVTSPPPATKAIKKKQFVPEPVTIEPAPTITNIYGREHRNERVKQKVTKMNTLFVNAI